MSPSAEDMSPSAEELSSKCRRFESLQYCKQQILYEISIQNLVKVLNLKFESSAMKGIAGR
jgi:hypothetical protein